MWLWDPEVINNQTFATVLKSHVSNHLLLIKIGKPVPVCSCHFWSSRAFLRVIIMSGTLQVPIIKKNSFTKSLKHLLECLKHTDQKLGKKKATMFFVPVVESLILASIILYNDLIFICSKYRAVVFKQFHETNAVL